MKNPPPVIYVAIVLFAILLTINILPSSSPQAAALTPTVFIRLPIVAKPLPTSTATYTVTATATHVATATMTPTSTTAPGPCLCYADLYNCDDFSTQAQAQACYNYCWNLGKGDIHHLDNDNDGIPCEGLP